MGIGERLRHFREINELSQKEAAKKLGIHNYQLANYENDRSEPNIATLKKMSQVYYVSIDALVGNRVRKDSSVPSTEEYVEADPLTIKLKEILDYISENKQ